MKRAKRVWRQIKVAWVLSALQREEEKAGGDAVIPWVPREPGPWHQGRTPHALGPGRRMLSFLPSPSGGCLCITKRGGKTCSIQFLQFSAVCCEKLLVGFVYGPLKSVGNSCYFGRLQAMRGVIFLQQHWVSFVTTPASIPSCCKGQHLPVPPSFPHGAFCSY